MDDVLQPVLQYGPGPKGGGEFWVYQSWFVTSSGSALVGPLLGPLDVGTNLNGYVQLTADKSAFRSVGTVQSTGKQTILSMLVSRTSQQPRAYLCVEIYNIDDNDCRKTPPDGKLIFKDLTMIDGAGKVVTPNMVKEVQHNHCNHDVISQGPVVTITWSTT